VAKYVTILEESELHKVEKPETDRPEKLDELKQVT
jgi:hypothetical protein